MMGCNRNHQPETDVTLAEYDARAYLNSKQRAQELPFFLHRYNWHRPHASISGNPLSADSA
jgi:hypothetical protein